LSSFHTHFISFSLSSPPYAISNNWSLDLQMWCDILNTLTSQAPPVVDKFIDASGGKL
jgi:hypothetical protein